jgi:hypothetical protein
MFDHEHAPRAPSHSLEKRAANRIAFGERERSREGLTAPHHA